MTNEEGLPNKLVKQQLFQNQMSNLYEPDNPAKRIITTDLVYLKAQRPPLYSYQSNNSSQAPT